MRDLRRTGRISRCHWSKQTYKRKRSGYSPGIRNGRSAVAMRGRVGMHNSQTPYRLERRDGNPAILMAVLGLYAIHKKGNVRIVVSRKPLRIEIDCKEKRE